jgi:hypothetical protein
VSNAGEEQSATPYAFVIGQRVKCVTGEKGEVLKRWELWMPFRIGSLRHTSWQFSRRRTTKARRGYCPGPTIWHLLPGGVCSVSATA